MKCNAYIGSVVCLTLLGLPAAHAASRKASAVNQQPATEAAEAYGQLPLSFEANQGQSDGQVKFLSRGSGYSLFLTGNEAVLALKRPEKKRAGAHLEPVALATRKPNLKSDAVLRMRLVGANAAAPVTGLEELPGKSNYFSGNDPSKWRTGVPNYAKVKFANVYPGVDLVYYGNQRQLEFDLVVQPGGDPNAVKLDFRAAVNGKPTTLRVDNKGNLVVGTEGGEVIFHKPVVYQPAANDETPATQEAKIDGKFVLAGAHQVRFQVGAYDKRRPLVIDPTLAYSTYLGGSDEDRGNAIAVDAAGNAYVTGVTGSTNFPTTPGAFQPTFAGGNRGGNSDVFVSKLNPAGSALLYSTYLGGSDGDLGFGIAVDASGNAYVTGYTFSDNFPITPGAFQTTFQTASGGGITDAFVSKLNPTGSALLYSTYLGAGDGDEGRSIAVDASGNAYVTGITFDHLPTTPGAFQTTIAGFQNAFVSKLNAAGSALVYSTYLGGSGGDGGNGIAVDASGAAYVTGFTGSSNFPITPGAFQTTFTAPRPGTGLDDAFVSKLNAAGSALVYSTYLGDTDSGSGIAVDASGDAYVTGTTVSSNFPTTAGAFQVTFGGGADVFVSKLNATGSALVYSTYLGVSDDLGSRSRIVIDASGNAYITGDTLSSHFPITPGAFQTTLHGAPNAFVSKLNAVGSALLYSTYLGGSKQDFGSGIALDASGNAYVTGTTRSADFPTTPGAFQTTSGGGSGDAFVSKFSFGIPFCSFRSKLELDADGDRDDGFELNSRFALGTGGSIHPLTQPVTLTIGRYSVTIPAGSFVKRDGGYEFAGVINGVRLAVLIRRGEERDGGGDEENRGDDNGNRCTTANYTVLAKGRGARLKGTTNPVTVTISIGDNTGTAQVHAEFER